MQFVVMCGLPASGKSTTGRRLAKLYDGVYISSDEIRKELFGDENEQSKNEEVFSEMEKRAKSALENKKDVVYDACNISYKRRIALINRFKRYNPYFLCYVMYSPYDDCLINNQKRERIVPDYVIKKMIMNFYFPQYFEGWDEICFIHSQNIPKKEYNLTDLFYGENGLCSIEHENPHHKLSIGDHCIATYFNCLTDEKADYRVRIAALLHDIGKPFCKIFEDSKGNPIDYAHYYQHHLVSGYQAFEYINKIKGITFDDILYILALIDFHMYPYFWEKDDNQKMKNKYMNLWGEDMFKDILLLHEADRKAH